MLKNKVAIVTGGASGLGKAGCKLLAKHGCKVLVADTNFEEACEVAKEIRADKGEAIVVKVDVTNRKLVQVMVNVALKEFGKIDILINNAGITSDKTLLKMTEEQLRRVLEVNLIGPINCAQAVLPHMIEQGSGNIINTSSIVGKYGNVGQTNYGAAKAAMINFTKTWSKELARKGIRVNAVAPGFIDTDMTEKMPENVLEYMKNASDMKRLGLPEEVANVYLFLASDLSSFVTGSVIDVNGGLTI